MTRPALHPRLVVRADASTRMGTGHVMRCLSLAQGWRRAGGQVSFVCAEITPALESRAAAEGFKVHTLPVKPGSLDDARQTLQMGLALEGGAGIASATRPDASRLWVVADGYHFGVDYQRAIKEAGARLLLADDYGHAGHYCADIVLNQNLSSREDWYRNREPHTRLLLGTRYALLREQFLPYRDWRRDVPDVARKALITLGGGDPDNVTGKVVEALSGMDLEMRVVVGGSNPHFDYLAAIVRPPSTVVRDAGNMPDLMAWADVAVVAGGTTSWELAFMGLPSAVIMIAENQRALAEVLHERGSAMNLGWYTDLDAGRWKRRVAELIASRDMRIAMSRRGRELVDGDGVRRVVEIMMSW